MQGGSLVNQPAGASDETDQQSRRLSIPNISFYLTIMMPNRRSDNPQPANPSGREVFDWSSEIRIFLPNPERHATPGKKS